MLFWDYWFTYIFKGYQNWGEKSSAHIYALCVMSMLLGCNVLSICSFILPEQYLNSKNFENLLILFSGLIISLNAFFFLRNKRYLRIASLYYEMSAEKKSRMKLYFWMYFAGTIFVLIVSFLY